MPYTLWSGKTGGKTGEPLLRRHQVAFFVVGGLVFAFNLLTQAAWWLFWPLMVWGAALMVHWLYVRTINVDDEWVEARTLDVRHSAYDLGHIDDIVDRHGDKLDDIEPPDRDKPERR